MSSLIIGLLIAMLFSAFFSGMEIAFVSSNRMLAEMDREKHVVSQKALDLFYAHPNTFVSTMLVGNNIALVIYGILFAQIFDQTLFASLDDGIRVLCDTLLSTLVVLFTGEFLPKTFFKSNPNSMLTFFALPAWVCYVVLWPVSRFATLLSKGILRLFGVRMDKNSGEVTEREGTFYLPSEDIVGGWASVYVEGHEDAPSFASVAFNEYAGRKSNGELNSQWASKPATMIRKVALVQALREAFPEDFAALYAPEEVADVNAAALDESPVVIPQTVDQTPTEAPKQAEVVSSENPEDVLFS